MIIGLSDYQLVCQWLIDTQSKAGVIYLDDSTGLYTLQTEDASGTTVMTGDTLLNALENWYAEWGKAQ